MKIQKNKIYWCKTEELVKEFLQEAEEQGFVWGGGDKPTKLNVFPFCKERTCISTLKEDKRRLAYCDKEYFEMEYPNIEIIEYKGATTKMYTNIKAVTLKDGVTTVELTDGRKGSVKKYFKDVWNDYTRISEALKKAFGVEEKKEDKTEEKEEPKFKVGDRVQFKSWEEVKDEIGFIWNMKHLCGTYATIRNINKDGIVVRLKDFTAKCPTDWTYFLDMLKPAVNEFKPHLYFSGNNYGTIGEKTNFTAVAGLKFINGISYIWQIRKVRSYKDLLDGEKIDYVTAILKENN